MMNAIKNSCIYCAEALQWLIRKPLMKNHIEKFIFFTVCGGSSLLLGGFIFPFLKRKKLTLSIARRDTLPIGLPNSKNICYLNALLQAMAANRSLIKSLKRCAAVRRDRLLCCLVAILEGLRCSASYLKKHDLVGMLVDAQRILLEELTLTERWSVDEQQDVHELFNFFMELANGYEFGRTAIRAGDGLLSASHFICHSDDPSVARCCHRNSGLGAKSAVGLTEALRKAQFHTLRMTMFQQHLVATQVICTKCSYRGSIKLTPESSITVFPYEFVKRRPMKDQSQRELPTNLKDLLQSQFCKSEKLTGIKCPQCHMTALTPPVDMLNDTTAFVGIRTMTNLALTDCANTCVSRSWVAHLPPCLVFYVQRAIWRRLTQLPPTDPRRFLAQSDSGGYTMKHSNHMHFPCHLDMAAYLRSGRASYPTSKNDLSSSQPAANHDKKQNKSSGPRIYALRSVIVHQGNSLQAGHYVTYRVWRASSNCPHDWLFTSDQSVSAVPLANVVAAQAYILFYERDEKPPIDLCPCLASRAPETRKMNVSDPNTEGPEFLTCSHIPDSSLATSDDEESALDDEDSEDLGLDFFNVSSRAESIQRLVRAADVDLS